MNPYFASEEKDLVFVPRPIHDDSVHPLLCPVCWNVTGIWLGKVTAKCVVCENVFETAPAKA